MSDQPTIRTALRGYAIDKISDFTRLDLGEHGMTIAAHGLLLAFLAMMVIGVYSVVQVIRTDGHVEFCTIEKTSSVSAGGSPFFRVIGYRSWRNDVVMATAGDVETAAHDADLVCPRRTAQGS